MIKICYEEYKPRGVYSELIEMAEDILADYKNQGYNLTLRQLYYQFVARDLLPEMWADPTTGSTNNMRAYKNLGNLISKARMGGWLDWESIEDRTRNINGLFRSRTPQSALRNLAGYYHIDWWEGQTYRLEIWVEKDALIGVVQKASEALDVEYFSCRGYTSMSEMWNAGRRKISDVMHGHIPVILHLGDHDPSGVDMSRDVEDRLRMFMEYDDNGEYLGFGEYLIFRRIALNMDQIRRYAPPPNPAKITDSRSKGYIANYGHESWELDALQPSVMEGIIKTSIEEFIDNHDAWNDRKQLEAEQKEKILGFANNWEK